MTFALAGEDMMIGQTGSASFPPTRAEALRRLAAFVPRAVSTLSPYLRYRLITEREVIAAVHDRHSPEAAEKFVQEVVWRTYWKGWLEARPEAWNRFEADRDAARDGLTGGLAKAVQNAEAGLTGIEGFDDWALELVETGYLHNHARMWFASIWIFTLRLPWVLGADFFLRHLLDADPASNTLSWRWVAGLQTRGKTYLATTDNIERYTEGRFAPRGLAREARALSEPPLPAARRLDALSAGRDGAAALLLMTPDDLDPSSLFLATTKVGGLVAITGATGWPWGNTAQAFVQAAVDDAATRASAHFDAPATIIAGFDADTIVAAAEQAGASAVITPEAPVGPIADDLARLAPQLAAAGLSMVRRRRPWDERFWPHATKGFFALRERIGDILAEDGLPV
jgi:deoxyribodipyrimidine photo-lyase